MNNSNGIRLDEAEGSIVRNNIVQDNSGDGISLWKSKGSTISNNTIVNNGINPMGQWGCGLALGYSGGSTLRDNKMSGNRYNFWVDGEDVSCLVIDVDTSNTVDGKLICYLINQNNLVIDPSTFPNTGYLGLVNSINITIRNLTLTRNGQGVSILSSNSVIIENLNISLNVYGITMDYSSNNTVVDNTINSNARDGISLQEGSNNTITGNVVEKNGYGISLYGSHYNNITDNAMISNDIGINLFGSNNNDICDNIMYSNRIGFYSSISHHNIIRSNTLSKNRYGMMGLYYSGSNIIYHNNFVNNEIQVSIDSGAYANTWDAGYPSGGNYWSGFAGGDYYSGPYQNETGSDGIGDTPYVIDANNQDRYPLMKPCAALLGDFDTDGDVDEDDLWLFCAYFITYYEYGFRPDMIPFDFDFDDDIDENDLWTFCDAFIDYYKAQ